MCKRHGVSTASSSRRNPRYRRAPVIERLLRETDEPPARCGRFVLGHGQAAAALASTMGLSALVVALVAAAPGRAAETRATVPLACLAQSGQPVNVSSPPDGAALELTPEPGQVLDLRGVTLTADPPRNPLVIRRAEGDVCVVGPTVIGNASRDASWSEMKRNHDGDGVLFARALGPFTLEGARIENVEDAVGPPKAPETPREVRFTVRGVYACHIRDDFVENDAALGGDISDTLVDGTHVFISARPGRGFEGEFPPATLTVRETLVRLDCKPDARADGQDTPAPEGLAGGACGVGRSLGMPFKWSGAAKNLHLEVANTIIRVDAAGRNGPRSMSFPPGDYRNVTLVWLGLGPYPGTLPEAGVSVTEDVTVWDTARAAWLRRHQYTPGAGCATR
jgi:hypothetical protein